MAAEALKLDPYNRCQSSKIRVGDCYYSLLKLQTTHNALVDAPDMVRSQMNFKRLSLIDIKIDIKRVSKKKELIEAMKAGDVQKKWENSSSGRKLIVRKRGKALTDFERFRLMLAKIRRAGLHCFKKWRILSLE